MSTPISGASAYCTVAQFLVAYDARNVADMISDADAPVSVGSLPTNQTLLTILQMASGRVEMSCLKGNKYQPADLAALTGNMQVALAALVADLAIGICVKRRPDKGYKMPESVAEAEKVLLQLEKGTLIWGLQETMNAGNTLQQDILEADLQTLDLATFTASRLFGIRSGQYRPYSGGSQGFS
jgi:hypothetical protein